MVVVPPEEQYETDTIFSQEGDVPDSYLQTKLREIDSDNEIFSDSEHNKTDGPPMKNSFLNLEPLTPAPTPTAVDSEPFKKLVEESKFVWGDFENGNSEIDNVVFQDELYDVTQDSFRYGRVTTGTSYNLVTGKMTDKVLEIVKAKDEENDETVETVTEDEETHRVTTEVTIPLNGSGDGHSLLTFNEMYESQMPKYFEYRKPFPEIKGIWTLLFDQKHYNDMSTFELQAAICAALNSKHHLIICIGVDSFNTVSGIEMTATDRVIFRMALTRAVAGEFQPPLVKIPPKQLTGVSPMKRDISELTSTIDVLFVPIIDTTESTGETITPNRFLIVVRVKELSEKLFQLSSGRIYVEENGRVAEMQCIDKAFRALISEKTAQQEPPMGSFFMLEPEPFMEDSLIEVEECSSEDEEGDDVLEKQDIQPPTLKMPEEAVLPVVEAVTEQKDTVSTKFSTAYESILDRLDSPHVQNFGWLLFASAFVYGAYKALNSRQ